MSPTLGLTGDVMLGRNVDEYHSDRPPDAVWGSALRWLRDCEGLFVNLECCLSTRGQRWTRTERPFHFRADPSWAVPALQAAGVDYASLANNHLLDFEAEALLDTVEHLGSAGISHAGAGPDEAAATAPTVVDVGDLRVGLLAFTDNTPEYAAGPETPGVARIEMDLDDDDRRIVRTVLDALQRRDPDLVVASLHWGPNNVVSPDDQYRAFGRWLLEADVDVIHGHSAHVFQGVERHADGLILYDCGDFVDDYRVDDELRNDRSFLFVLELSPVGDLERLRLRPTEIADRVVARVDGPRCQWWHETMRERSAPFGTADAFERDGTDLALAV